MVTKIDSALTQIDSLKIGKHDISDALEFEKQTSLSVKDVVYRQTQLGDTMKSLECWVDKYLPLKLQH